MSITVGRLHKELTKLIEQGHARKHVMINKRTFSHVLEPDGVCILPVEDFIVDSYTIADDDGGIATNKDGSEKYKTSLVLIGGGDDEDEYFAP